MPNAVLSRRKLVITTLAAAGAGGIWYMNRLPFEGQAISPVEAHALAGRGEITLVDIRRPDEWRTTGIGEGAWGIDMRDEDFIAQLEGLVDYQRDAPVALICARGVRSNRMSQRLLDAGFTNIIDVPEGMLGSSSGPGWLSRGLPTETYQG
ncbi:rhodanese-like domain-containing protein [Thalassobius sp. I31.1]|uniref:rhodanese-like domain-containing protein n=1 Tax=Thalassobius sp. I31.1 TaxID=2109912 RepID=UPI000D19895F|nr:rhodanese-like domain-containing protein [Thalassobius sp. I31.1]